jgi:exodeoxyribonuclease VII small subunit
MARKKQSFEEKMLTLEEIARKLDGGEEPLEEMIKLYEQGMKLIVSCNEQLSEAELQVTTIRSKTAKSSQDT